MQSEEKLIMVSLLNYFVFKEMWVDDVSLACLYCRRSHMTCDSNRPCARCVKRNIGHLCHDEVKDKHRENGTESTSQSPAVEATSPDQHIDGEIKTGITLDNSVN